MILYNVTVNIDEDVHEEWLQWMIDEHIPDVMRTGKFLESKVCKIEAFSDGGVSYSIQYLAPDMETYDLYSKEDAPRLQAEHHLRYAGKYAAFRTLLRVVHHNRQDV